MIPSLALALFLQAGGTDGAERESLAVKGADLELLREVRHAAEKLEGLRGAEFRSSPVAVRGSTAARRAAAERLVALSITDERLRARGRAWVDIGLGEPESPLRIYRTLAEDVEGVSLDSSGGKLLVDPERLTEKDFAVQEEGDPSSSLLLATGIRPDEPLVVHVLVHLLQKQRTGKTGLPDTTDSLLASAAWAEGEANVVALRYLFQAMGLEDEVVRGTMDPGIVLSGALLPETTGLAGPEAALLDWVYRDGFVQAARRFRDGGWSSLDQAMRRRLKSRDLLHLDRSPLRREEIPEPDPGLPEPFSLADRDELGEEGIVVLVSTQTGKDNLGLLAGDGWSGDSLFRWEIERGKGVTLWITRWITPEEASDFEYGYRRVLESRFPDHEPIATEDGRQVLATSRRVIRVLRAGREVLIRVSPPEFDRPILENVEAPSAQ